jgi:hypothetical protein
MKKEHRPKRVGEDIVEYPTLKELRDWNSQGGCEATDGCWVEIDGTCPHGKRSWMLELGLA